MKIFMRNTYALRSHIDEMLAHQKLQQKLGNLLEGEYKTCVVCNWTYRGELRPRHLQGTLHLVSDSPCNILPM